MRGSLACCAGMEYTGWMDCDPKNVPAEGRETAKAAYDSAQGCPTTARCLHSDAASHAHQQRRLAVDAKPRQNGVVWQPATQRIRTDPRMRSAYVASGIETRFGPVIEKGRAGATVGFAFHSSIILVGLQTSVHAASPNLKHVFMLAGTPHLPSQTFACWKLSAVKGRRTAEGNTRYTASPQACSSTSPLPLSTPPTPELVPKPPRPAAFHLFLPSRRLSPPDCLRDVPFVCPVAPSRICLAPAASEPHLPAGVPSSPAARARAASAATRPPSPCTPTITQVSVCVLRLTAANHTLGTTPLDVQPHAAPRPSPPTTTSTGPPSADSTLAAPSFFQRPLFDIHIHH
ncbi:hypothetical protein EK21DRAFT_94454 [Setomelanomma holmii]|uniref:Uncharacterized protein n=1 Tax=Setomelanomma holmii TaxID=210430 RepID=A0A9P4GXV5_9PLEO|nr:hypothetical protein EK21DRAFT_94454 [Setomelanomma holmii]